MSRFEMPEDLSALSGEDLEELLADAVAAFDALSGSTEVTADDLAAMRELSAHVAAIRTEKAERARAAEEAAAEIDRLAAEVRGEDPDAPADDASGDEEPAEEPEIEAEAEAEREPEPEKEPVAASAAGKTPARRSYDLSGVRRRQPRVLPPEPDPTPTVTAAVDVPGYSPGQPLEMDGVTEGIVRRANALKTAGGGMGIVASYRLPFTEEFMVNDASSAPEGTRAIIQAANQTRLPGGDVVASGGWCAPSETIYSITNVACPERLWDAPEINLTRGGISYFMTPALDVSQLTWIHTEADDIAGNTKPCFKIPCPDPVQVRCDAIGVCLEAGILTQRFFPELIDHYRDQAMVAHEIRIRQELFNQAIANAIQVTIQPTFGAFSAVYAAVALQVADMIEKYSLCESISLEVVFPWWSRGLFLSDIARQNGVTPADVDPAVITRAFARLGVSVQFVGGIEVPSHLGGENPATDWPSEMPVFLYPAGAYQIGRGAEVSLGVVHDSTKFSTNDYTALFSEECVATVFRGPEARLLRVPVCADGRTGEQIGIDCPAEASPSESPGSPAESPAEESL